MALVTAAEVKRRLPGFDASDTDSDTLIAELIAAADEVLALHCGYPPHTVGTAPSLETQTYTRYYGGDDKHFGLTRAFDVDPTVLQLDVLPVTSITTIHDDSNWAYAAADLVDSGDYTEQGEVGKVYLHPDSVQGSFTRYRRAAKVVFVAGWVTVPDQVKEAALQLIRHWVKLQTTQGRTNVTKRGSSNAMRRETLPESVVELMHPFVLPWVL